MILACLTLGAFSFVADLILTTTLPVSVPDADLTLIDEHGHVLLTLPPCDPETYQSARRAGALVDLSPRAAAQAARLADRVARQDIHA